jgi:DNA invertase Pin-like site-specific DNA recombinase
MKNLDSVFAAYLIGWAVFFVFYLSVAKRTSSLRDELERMKDSIQRGK